MIAISDSIDPETDPLEATCWFIACQQARAVFDSYTIKDLARMIVDGDELAGPYKTEQHVQEWLDGIQENYEDYQDNVEMWKSLSNDLDAHFGIRRPGVTSG